MVTKLRLKVVADTLWAVYKVSPQKKVYNPTAATTIGVALNLTYPGFTKICSVYSVYVY